jgi:flagellar motility protein MotE (MotC chaperone)
MMKWARDFRLIPLVLLATICLFALKVSGLVFDGGYTLGERLENRYKNDLTVTTADSIPKVTPIIVEGQLPTPKQSWAQEMFNYRDSGSDSGRDITGSVGKSEESAPGPAKVANKPTEPPKDPGGTMVLPDPGRLAPAGERAILERLTERRTEMDARARDIEMRENLLKAAEKRVEARVAELKALEGQVTSAADARDKAELDRFKNIVAMYENMKPKDAARIFDRLDLKILVNVSTQMNPRKMSEVLAQMSPDAAERLTVELASQATGSKNNPKDGLPKIDGRPSGT